MDDGTVAVEVLIPDTFPTLVTGLASHDVADAWIAKHKASTNSSRDLKRSRFRLSLPNAEKPPR